MTGFAVWHWIRVVEVGAGIGFRVRLGLGCWGSS